MSNTRHSHPPADGDEQVFRAQWLKRRMVRLALAHDTAGLTAVAEQHAGNPVALGAAACLLAQDLAAATEESALALAALSYSAHGPAGA